MLCWPKAVDSDSKKVQHRNHGTQKKGKSRIVCDKRQEKEQFVCETDSDAGVATQKNDE